MTNSTSSQNKGKAIKRYLMIFLVLVNGVLLSTAFFFQKGEKETKVELQKREAFISEIEDALKTTEANLGKYKDLYEELQEAYSLANEQIDELKAEIAQIKSGKSSDDETQKRYRLLQKSIVKHLGTIDSLVSANQLLSKENLKLKTRLEEEKLISDLLATEKADLESKLGLQSTPEVSNMIAVGISVNQEGKESQTFDLKRIDKLKLCFDVNQNPLAIASRKWMYLVVTDPNGSILQSIESGTFKSGTKQIEFTAHVSVLHDNNKKNICIYTKDYESFPSGNYLLDIYHLGENVQSTSFELK